ncbi:hydrogenase expression/formation protein [Pelagibius marinus]|uniref:hydrogenase expression/formation protein n=1 Tax=Pelagibius marinus TaxID=2762760 RepID=UPI001872B639|nr:hydrogenase expression/formation protein [Pelagibius marinus]
MSDTPISSFLGPGSQPGDEDGGQLEYMQMPAAMMTFAAPDLPEPEDTAGLEAAKTALAEVLARLQNYERDGAHNIVSLAGLDAANLELVNQVLGEGEVSVVAGAELQAQEAVLAGVWRVRGTDGEGRVVRDEIEVGTFPTSVAALAFKDARPAVTIPESFAPDVFNAPPLLPEINEHIPQVAAQGVGGAAPHVINLSLLPHTEADLALLAGLLGEGPLTILSRGYGNCRVTSSGTHSVWWVQFYNSQDALILNSIEISKMPEVVCAAAEDIAESAERLHEILEVYR